MKKYLLIITCCLSFCVNAQIQEKTNPEAASVIVIPSPEDQPSTTSSKDEIIDFPEEDATYKGGQDALQKFVQKNLKYPLEARDQNIQGRVFVSFVVEKNGRISNVIIERGIDPLLDKEVLRLVKSMPKWNPGKMKGKKIRSRCRLPVVFKIE